MECRIEDAKNIKSINHIYMIIYAFLCFAQMFRLSCVPAMPKQDILVDHPSMHGRFLEHFRHSLYHVSFPLRPLPSPILLQVQRNQQGLPFVRPEAFMPGNPEVNIFDSITCMY